MFSYWIGITLKTAQIVTTEKRASFHSSAENFNNKYTKKGSDTLTVTFWVMPSQKDECIQNVSKCINNTDLRDMKSIFFSGTEIDVFYKHMKTMGSVAVWTENAMGVDDVMSKAEKKWENINVTGLVLNVDDNNGSFFWFCGYRLRKSSRNMSLHASNDTHIHARCDRLLRNVFVMVP